MITKSPDLESFSRKDFPHHNNYQLDLEYLKRIVHSAYPRLEDKISLGVLDSIFEEQIVAAEVATDKEFNLILNRLMLALDDTHSCFTIDYRKFDSKFFHLYLMYENGYWYVYNVDELEPNRIIGSRLLELNGIDANSIDSLIQLNVCGETSDAKRWKYMRRQKYPTFLNKAGITNDENKLVIKYRNEEATFVDTIYSRKPGKYHQSSTKKYDPIYLYKQNEGFFYTIDSIDNFAYFQMNTSLDYVAIKSDLKNYTSIFTRPFAKIYLKKQKKEARDFGKAIASFYKEVEAHNIENIILDIRNNGGGDERLGKQFLWYLSQAHQVELKGFTDFVRYSEYFEEMVKKEARQVKKLYKSVYDHLPEMGAEINMTKLMGNRLYFDDITSPGNDFYLDSTINKFDGNLYLLTSPYTNSAAQVLATTVVDNNLGKVIGLAPGNKPTTQTGTLLFKLPYSKKILTMSYYFMERPDVDKNEEKELKIDAIIYQTYEDRLKGKNTAFEYVMDQIKEIEKGYAN